MWVDPLTNVMDVEVDVQQASSTHHHHVDVVNHLKIMTMSVLLGSKVKLKMVTLHSPSVTACTLCLSDSEEPDTKDLNRFSLESQENCNSASQAYCFPKRFRSLLEFKRGVILNTDYSSKDLDKFLIQQGMEEYRLGSKTRGRPIRSIVDNKSVPTSGQIWRKPQIAKIAFR